MPPAPNLNFGFSVVVHAHPSSKKPRLILREPGVFDVYVAEPAEYGRANEAIRRALAEHFGVRPGYVQLQTGLKSVRKRYSVFVDKPGQG